MAVWGLQRWHVALGLFLVWMVTQNQVVCALSLFVAGLVAFAWMRLRCPPQALAEDKLVERLRAGGVLAHRGGSRDAPENTMAALRVALEQKVIGSEVDVAMSLDGQAVLIHDDTLERTTDGRGFIADHTLEQLRTLDASKGHPLHEQYRGERIPTLEETIVWAKQNGQILFLDCKPTVRAGNLAMRSPFLEPSRDVAVAVCDLIAKHQVWDTTVVCSFWPLLLWSVRRRDPRVKVAFTWRENVCGVRLDGSRRNDELWKHVGSFIMDSLLSWTYDSLLAQFLGVSLLLLHKDSVSKKYAEETAQKGMQIVMWTVNSLPEKRYFKHARIPYMSDAPDEDQEADEQRG